ncbi:hypothetical protein [Lunatimonas sp.]|uniref:hypothetical protein n=1 Tax=Lunatimonas sp. TaxID=2060141 RepID=UPI00263A7E8C|nr:hypothetical protein [Lunatimonas sp.]
MTSESTLPTHTVFKPQDLTKFGQNHKLPIFVGNLDVGHGGTYSQPFGGDFARVASQWYKWQLKGDKEAEKLFTGTPNGLSKSQGWVVDRKKMN